MSTLHRCVARFGVFEVDLTTGDIRKRSQRVRLQELPTRVLIQLLEQPGELVARAALAEALWGKIVVDTDQGLNTALRKIRRVLGDSAKSPRFLETLPGRGYRFLGDVAYSCGGGPPCAPEHPRAEPGASQARRASPDLALEPVLRARLDAADPAGRGHFVSLTLLLDHEHEPGGRWKADPRSFSDLQDVLGAVESPAIVLLGPPGSGKSTILCHLENDLMGSFLAGEKKALGFRVSLNQFRREPARASYPDPETWLYDRWRARSPGLPSLSDLLAEGRMVLLCDGLNEIPSRDAGDLRQAILVWKGFLDRLALERPGNRMVFACRTLDYSSPLSTPRVRVPQVVIDAMSDAQVERFLEAHAGERGKEIWKGLEGTAQLEVLRLPYFLLLLVQQLEVTGGIPQGPAALFTGFVRHALHREVEQDNPLLTVGGLLEERDLRKITQWRWSSPWELPERGMLIRSLSDLAFALQDRSAGDAQTRVPLDAAVSLLPAGSGDRILRAGEALSVLVEEPESDEIAFYHQLVQEFFAARKLARSLETDRARREWKSAALASPTLLLLRTLPTSETLPPLESSGWEETALMAAAMTADPVTFVNRLADADLPLAARCASRVEVGDRLVPAVVDALKDQLAIRSRDPVADLRARIEAGLELGLLGDPRFKRASAGSLLPPLAEIPEGRYPLGDDATFEHFGVVVRTHVPRHEVQIEAFQIGRFPVTNAEWRAFMLDGGYENEAWWETQEAKRWRNGEGTGEGVRANIRRWLARFQADPERLEERRRHGQMALESYERWQQRLRMSERDLDAHLESSYPGGMLREPMYWRNSGFNNSIQPVVGICWYEARAYCRWLASRTESPFRLPKEAEWEAAARGFEAREYAWGEGFDPLRANTAETRVKRTTPIGVFPEGDTPLGITDLTGNVAEWTDSLFGAEDLESASFPYPYRSDDGREDPLAGAEVRRVIRGGAWYDDPFVARASSRIGALPDFRNVEIGFRLVTGVGGNRR